MVEDKTTWKEELAEWAEVIVGGIALLWFFYTFIAEPFVVDGPSMNPTLQTTERVMVDKLSYRLHTPEKNDIIVFEYQRDRSRHFIKRVIATGGDTIEITGGVVYVNDKPLKEDYILDTTETEYPKIVVPEGTVFAMGDNRNNSADSRTVEVGFISLDSISGKAFVVYWPFPSFRMLP